jgi:hypothetical protein
MLLGLSAHASKVFYVRITPLRYLQIDRGNVN